MSRLRTAALMAAYRRGFEIRRHPAWRRQHMLQAHGIDLVLDVGAAVGGYGTQLRQFGYTGRIVSFEPLDTPYAELSAVAARDDQWSVRQSALGSEAGRSVINVAANSDSSSLLPMAAAHTEAAPENAIIGQQAVTVERLDDVLDEVAGADDRIFLKIDAQGFEGQVLAGAARTLDRCRGLQLELSFVPLYQGGLLVNEAVAIAYDAGFSMVGIEQGWAAESGQMLQADGVFFRL